MSSAYPGAIDNFTDPLTTDPMNAPSHAGEHTNANDAIHAVEVNVGTTAAPNFLPIGGGTMSGSVAMGSNKITGLANGVAASDAATVGQLGGGGFNGFDYGDGSDGVVAFDGTNTFAAFASTTGAAPNLIYTLTRDVLATNLTVSATVNAGGAGGNFALRYTGTFHGTSTGVLQNNGANAPGTTGGATQISGTISRGTAGGAAASSNVGSPGTNTSLGVGGIGGTGGASGTSIHAGGVGGTLGTALSAVIAASSLHTLISVNYLSCAPQGSVLGSGGTGGGAGGSDVGTTGGGGGGGAGGILLVGAITIFDAGFVLQSNGGNGASSASGNGGGGGGGGGGFIQITTGSYTNNGATIQSLGGNPGNGFGTGSNGFTGSAGTIRVTTSWV